MAACISDICAQTLRAEIIICSELVHHLQLPDRRVYASGTQEQDRGLEFDNRGSLSAYNELKTNHTHPDFPCVTIHPEIAIRSQGLGGHAGFNL